MNREFVNIKVDREERPDVDRVYMTFVQATTGGGGWPMSVWLTPDLKPFVGGTYFPPEERYGQPAFKKVLERIADSLETRSRENPGAGNEDLEALREARQPHRVKGNRRSSVLDAAYEQLDRSYDAEGRRIRRCAEISAASHAEFPITRFYASDPQESEAGKHALDMALFTLRKMAAGGMHDHLGGGFHRYSVDRYWHVPHFEKMLYDQAQLADRVSRRLPNHKR